MLKIRHVSFLLGMLLTSMASNAGQVSIGIGLPDVNIAINVPAYPQLVVVPGYPVYYAPQLEANFFFYDGRYWVFQNDSWFSSAWYNGPWTYVAPEAVPLFLLRVPVRYYRQPPAFFLGWRPDIAPLWGNHWGREWEQRRSGWDNWNHSAAPAPAPLPIYQRQYSGNRYPRQIERQQQLQKSNYLYQPREHVVPQSGVARPQNQEQNPNTQRNNKNLEHHQQRPQTVHGIPGQSENPQLQKVHPKLQRSQSPVASQPSQKQPETRRHNE